MNNGGQSNRSWITEGIIIALITASAYFWALRYESGWCEYFQIPVQLISLNLTNVLAISGPLNLVFVSILIPFLVWFLIWNPLLRYSYWLSNEYPTVWFLLSSITISGILIMFSIYHKEQLFVSFWIIISIPVLFFIFVLVRPLVTKRWQGRYWDKFKASVRPRQMPEPRGIQIPHWLVNLTIILVGFVWIWLGTYVAYRGGKERAELEKVFSIVAPHQGVADLVVLRIYGDYLVTAPLIRDSTGNQVEKKLYILKLSDMSKTPLSFETVGPLTVKALKHSNSNP